jgi:hypothetical protein
MQTPQTQIQKSNPKTNRFLDFLQPTPLFLSERSHQNKEANTHVFNNFLPKGWHSHLLDRRNPMERWIVPEINVFRYS